MLVKCICTYCAGHLEFEDENAGEKIKCPHCGFETMLCLPGTQPEEDDFGVRKAKGFSAGRPLVLAALAVLVLAAAGYCAYRWVLPPLKDWLPYTDSAVLPVLVLLLGLLLLVVLIAWVMFPLLIYFQLRKMTEVLAGIAIGLRPVLTAAPIIEEDEDESSTDEERALSVAEKRETSSTT